MKLEARLKRTKDWSPWQDYVSPTRRVIAFFATEPQKNSSTLQIQTYEGTPTIEVRMKRNVFCNSCGQLIKDES